MGLNRTEGAPPLYLQVSDILRKRILEGHWQNGEALASELQLCEEFSIARGTLRQALDKLASEGLLSRERGRGTFVTPKHGHAMTSGGLAGAQIAFVVPYVRDTYVSTILLGMEKSAEEHGLSIVFHHVSNSVEEQAATLYRCLERELAGIVLYPVDSMYHEAVATLAGRKYPLVLVDRYLQGVETDYVISDNFGGALQATQHLIQLGHEQIAFVSWRDPSVSMAHRLVGYRQALEEQGIAHDPGLVCEVEGYPQIDLNALCQSVVKDSSVTAVFAANDQIALAIYQAARRLGRCIPDDLVGFDNLDVVAHLDVPLTTVAQDAFQIGQNAVDLLIRRLHGEAQNAQQSVVPTTLIVRRSCGSAL